MDPNGSDYQPGSGEVPLELVQVDQGAPSIVKVEARAS